MIQRIGIVIEWKRSNSSWIVRAIAENLAIALFENAVEAIYVLLDIALIDLLDLLIGWIREIVIFVLLVEFVDEIVIGIIDCFVITFNPMSTSVLVPLLLGLLGLFGLTGLAFGGECAIGVLIAPNTPLHAFDAVMIKLTHHHHLAKELGRTGSGNVIRARWIRRRDRHRHEGRRSTTDRSSYRQIYEWDGC